MSTQGVKRGATVMAVVLIVGLLTSCADLGQFYLRPGGADPSTGTGAGVVLGTVRTIQGGPIAGAQISVSGLSATSNEQGWFVISSVPTGAGAVVSASAASYASGFRVVDVRATESSYVAFVLGPIQTTQTINTSVGGVINTSIGSVSLPAGGYVDEQGNPVSGSIQADVSIFNVESRDDLSLFPGDFEGIDAGGARVPLETFGFLYVALNQGQRAVQLAAGQVAELRLTIANRLRSTAPASIPLWSFDESSGIWRQEGTATRQGDVYVGQASHFTWYNYDVVYSSTTLTGRVVTPDGTPIDHAMVQHLGVTYNGGQRRYTGADGRFRMPVRPNAQVHIWAEKGTVSSAVRTESTPSLGQERDISDLVLGSSGAVSVLVTLAWGAQPLDMDSHLYVPGTSTQPAGYHVYYDDMGRLDGYPYAQLDTDDRRSFGPEVITVTQRVEGTYLYCVYNYSGSPDIATSQAKVTYLDNWGRLRELRVPTSNASNHRWWKVLSFDVDASGRVTNVGYPNQLVASCDPVVGADQEPLGKELP